jgi:hypothetical protein
VRQAPSDILTRDTTVTDLPATREGRVLSRSENVLSRLIPTLIVLLFVFQLALLPAPRSDGHLLSSDGRCYYAYMRSLLLDGDLDLTNDIALYNARVPAGNEAPVDAWYVFSVGPGLLWSPFFLVGHGIARLAAAVGMSSNPDGFGFIEEACVQLASVGYAALGLVLLVGVVRRLVPRGVPPAAVAGTFLVSPALYYSIFEPTMSHTLELFSVSLFLWLLYGRPARENRDYFLLGVAAALVFLVRWQNIVLWVVAAPLALGLPPFGRRATARNALTAIAGAAPVMFLQLLFWKAVFGNFITVPQGAGFMAPAEPHLLEVLFSTRHGLLSWHPALALGIAGLAWLRPRALAWSFAIAFALDLYVCSIAGDWWGGDAFGMRRLTGALPLLMLGVAAVIASPHPSRRPAWVLGAVALLAAWNVAFMVQYRLGFIHPGDPLTFREMFIDKLTLPFALLRRFAG